MSLFDTIKTRPDTKFYEYDFDNELDKDTIEESGGYIRWCSTCLCFDSPNRPCSCGLWMLQRVDNGYFWGAQYGRDDQEWVKKVWDAAQESDSKDLMNIAMALNEDIGEMRLIRIGYPDDTIVIKDHKAHSKHDPSVVYSVDLRIRNDNLSDKWFFKNLPTKDDLLKAIERHAKLAPEYEFMYNMFSDVVSKCDWPTLDCDQLGISVDNLYLTISRNYVIDNE